VVCAVAPKDAVRPDEGVGPADDGNVVRHADWHYARRARMDAALCTRGFRPRGLQLRLRPYGAGWANHTVRAGRHRRHQREHRPDRRAETWLHVARGPSEAGAE